MKDMNYMVSKNSRNLCDGIYQDVAGGYSNGRLIKVAVWNYYEEIVRDGYLFKNTEASIGHNLLQPWYELYRYGQSKKIHFVTLDQVQSLDELDAVLFIDRPGDSRNIQIVLQSNLMKYLLIYETALIKPDNWDENYHLFFDRIFTWSDDHVDHQRYIKQNFAIAPQPQFHPDDRRKGMQGRKMCTLIAGAKSSKHPNELYSKRVESIRWFEQNHPADFDLYGIGWSAENFPSYRGSVDNKLETLKKYQFAVCYENANGYGGYITEKILDCFLVGVVPIYLGAPNVSDWIPESCYIDASRFDSHEALYEHLKGITQDRYVEYLQSIYEFLSSPKIYPFTIESFITTLTGYIAKDVKRQRREEPEVSIVIPNYNYGRYLETTIQSVISQNIENCEILVFDNDSDDQSQDICLRYQDRPDFYFMRNTRNIGARHNWSNALKVASGRYVTILSSDDFMVPGHLHRMTKTMNEHPEVALSYCPCVWVDAAGTPLFVAKHIAHSEVDYIGGRDEAIDLIMYDCYITPSAALIRCEDLDKIGGINTSLNGAIDFDMWIRLAEVNSNFAFFKQPGVCYRCHDGQDTERLSHFAGLLEDYVDIISSSIDRGRIKFTADKSKFLATQLVFRRNKYQEATVSRFTSKFFKLLEKLLRLSSFDSSESADLVREEQVFLSAMRDALDIYQVIQQVDEFVKRGRISLAIALYTIWLNGSTSTLKFAAAFNLGIILEQQGCHAQALQAYRLAQALNPSFNLALEKIKSLEASPLQGNRV